MLMMMNINIKAICDNVTGVQINGGMFKEKCCKQCGQVKFRGTMTKWPVQDTQLSPVFPCRLCFLRYFPFISLILLTTAGV